MNCATVEKLLSAYYDGELADEMGLHVSEHLHRCPKCAEQLSGFATLSKMALELTTPPTPESIWREIDRQLDRQPKARGFSNRSTDRAWIWQWSGATRFAVAATVLVAVGIGWFTYRAGLPEKTHTQFTTEFGQYLTEFRRDADSAQQYLLAKYENQLVDSEQAVESVGYRPAVADGLPEGYTLASTHVVKMPCCTCTQSICKRNDGSTLAIFEHDDKEPAEWFGTRPGIDTVCNGKPCCLVELDDRIAASWKRGERYITLIGVRDVAEVNQMVAWLNAERQSERN